MKSAIRGDLSNHLIHLTKRQPDIDEKNVFESIVNERRLRGSDTDIRGGYKCVCFSEAPIHVIARSLIGEDKKEFRYAPYGVMVSKNWLFSKGGRPVLYQPEAEYYLLNEESRYKHVKYDPINGTDYSWEREWRIKIDELPLDPKETTLIVPTRETIDNFINIHTQKNSHLTDILGIPVNSQLEWHFIALSDLGLVGIEP